MLFRPTVFLFLTACLSRVCVADSIVLNQGTLDWIAAAQSGRADILFVGDSTVQFGGNGWDAGMIIAGKERFGLAGTGLISNGSFGGPGYGYSNGGANASFGWDTSIANAPADRQGYAVKGEVVNAGASPASFFGYQVNGNSPTLSPTAAYDWHVYTASDSTGSMSAVRRRDSSPYTVYQSVGPVATSTPVDGLQHTVFSFDDTPEISSGLTQAFRLVNTTETSVFYSRLTDPNAASGITVSSIGYGGKTTLEFYNDIWINGALSPQGRAHYLSSLVDGGSGKLNIMIAEGFNDRNETDPSVNGITDGNSPEAFADNMDALMDAMRADWLAGGHDPTDLSFTLLGMFEIQSDTDPEDEGLMRDYALELENIALSDTQVSFVNLYDLAPKYAEASGLGYSTDGLHPTLLGSTVYSRVLLNALFLQGDFNNDGFVGVDDLNIVLTHWNQSVTPGNVAQGDPNGDGFVGVDDLNLVLVNWNQGTPPQGILVPEPASAVMLSLFALLHRRRTARR